MPIRPISARPPYIRRSLPSALESLLVWLGIELSNVQRGIPPQTTRTVTIGTDIPTSSDDTILYDATTQPITVSLPMPAQATGLKLTCKKIDSSGNTVTLVGTIDGAVNPTLATQYRSTTIQSDGSTWYTLSSV